MNETTKQPKSVERSAEAPFAARNGSETKMDCYVGIKPCGCMVAWVYDSKERPKDVAKSVAQLIKDGYRVESANTDNIRSNLGPCKCKSPNKEAHQTGQSEA